MENSKNKHVFIVLGVIGLCLITLGITYAYWILTKQQTGENVVNTACLNIAFTGENDINLDKAYPMKPEQLESFLSTATPYHFTIHNECSELATVTINLESLNVGEEKQLEDQYINAVLYQTNYKVNLFKNKKLTEKVLNDENKVIKNSLHAYKLYSFTLKQNEEKEFNLQLYLDPDTPMEDANMNASWKGKITLSSEYKEDKFRNSGTLRTISSSYNGGKYDNNGMWKYKDKLTKIVIENKKEDKIAQEGETKYGPFNEGAGGTDAVVSYVICDSDEINCTGYLQSEGGIKLSSGFYLFYDFKKVTTIEGLENLDTSQVDNMSYMFSKMNNLQSINLSELDTSHVINMNNMFQGMSKLQELDVSNFDTSSVKNMSWMFNNCSELKSLDLSSFDTGNVTDMGYMFYGMKNLQELNLKSFNTSQVEDMSFMFTNSSGLTSLDLSGFDTSQVNNMSDMFNGMKNLQNLNFGDNFNTSKVKNMSYMFYYCSSLQSLDLSKFNTSQVENMSYMFANSSGLTSLDLNAFDTNNVINMNEMFNGTTGLQSITFGQNFVHNPEATTVNMFTACTAPERPTGDTWQGVSF